MHAKPKKSLGQNFLVDPNIRRKIIASCGLKASDIVLEIGAGRGELTRLIAERVNKVYAVEIDANLCHILKANLKGCANIEIINKDILKFDLKRYFTRRSCLRIKVIGNIPYYITTPIIERLLKIRDRIETIFITVQKEVAQRMVSQAGSKNYGAFSCFVQYYTQAQIIFRIKRTSFLPSPKVDSCFLRLSIRQVPIFKIENERLFFKIIRAAFNQRRKILKNSLENIIAPEKLAAFFKEYKLNPKIRPENLGLKDFATLSEAMS